MVAIINPISLKPGGMLFEGSRDSDKIVSTPTFTCCHCNRAVFLMDAHKTGGSYERRREKYLAENTCRKCMGYTCRLLGCVTECNPFARSVDMAVDRSPQDHQPYLLRDAEGYPVTRLAFPDGTERLVRTNDIGPGLGA